MIAALSWQASQMLLLALLVGCWVTAFRWATWWDRFMRWLGSSWSCHDCGADGYGLAYSHDGGATLRCARCEGAVLDRVYPEVRR